MPEVGETNVSKESVYIPGGQGREALQVNLLSGDIYAGGIETYKTWEGDYMADNQLGSSCHFEQVPSVEVQAREAFQRVNYQLYHLLHTAEPAVVTAMKQVIRGVEAESIKRGDAVHQNVANFTRHERGRIYTDKEDGGHRVFMGETIFPQKTPVLVISDGLLSSALPTNDRFFKPEDQSHEAISIPVLNWNAIQENPEAATQGTKDITTLAGVAHVRKFLSGVLVLERSKEYDPGIDKKW